jgi:hypothetical protein
MRQYEWITLELLDQLVRDKSGGDMEHYLRSRALDNAEYVMTRIGPEAANYMGVERMTEPRRHTGGASRAQCARRSLRAVITETVQTIRSVLGSADQARMTLCKILLGKQGQEVVREGLFRRSGECHRWMYDRFSLIQLLEHCGFSDVRACTAFESRIAGFASFGLDVVDGKVRKPDSLFMEAAKR